VNVVSFEARFQNSLQIFPFLLSEKPSHRFVNERPQKELRQYEPAGRKVNISPIANKKCTNSSLKKIEYVVIGFEIYIQMAGIR
jgi:hypothetical protein